jgi:hypothetical protein
MWSFIKICLICIIGTFKMFLNVSHISVRYSYQASIVTQRQFGPTTFMNIIIMSPLKKQIKIYFNNMNWFFICMLKIIWKSVIWYATNFAKWDRLNFLRLHCINTFIFVNDHVYYVMLYIIVVLFLVVCISL